MKKLLSLVAIVGIMASCNDKKDESKTEEKKTDTVTTTNPSTTEPNNTTPPTTTMETPKFSDPEIQKFVDDYAAFIAEWKAGYSDPAKAAELTKRQNEWSTKSQSIGVKLANNPEDLKKWTDWWMAVAKEMTPPSK